jgi:hypothetical protein
MQIEKKVVFDFQLSRNLIPGICAVGSMESEDLGLILNHTDGQGRSKMFLRKEVKSQKSSHALCGKYNSTKRHNSP